MYLTRLTGILLLASATTLLTPATGDAQFLASPRNWYSTTAYGRAGTGSTQYPVYYHGYSQSPAFSPILSPAYGPATSPRYYAQPYVPNAYAPSYYPSYRPYSTRRRWGG